MVDNLLKVVRLAKEHDCYVNYIPLINSAVLIPRVSRRNKYFVNKVVTIFGVDEWNLVTVRDLNELDTIPENHFVTRDVSLLSRIDNKTSRLVRNLTKLLGRIHCLKCPLNVKILLGLGVYRKLENILTTKLPMKFRIHPVVETDESGRVIVVKVEVDSYRTLRTKYYSVIDEIRKEVFNLNKKSEVPFTIRFF